MDTLSIAIAVLAISSLILPLFHLFRRHSGNLPGYILISALMVTLFLVVTNSISPSPSTWFGQLLASDRLGGIFAIVTLSITLMVAIASINFIRSQNNPSYYCLLSFTALGMLLLSYSQDLLMLFISWELMSIPTYALAGFDKKRAQSNEASVKYAIIGAMSSAILLYAISITYGISGTTQIAPAIKGIISQPYNLFADVAILLFIAGFGFKMAIVPFHMWIPDTYEGAPTTISTLLAAATKKGGFIAAIRVLLALATVYVVTQNPVFSLANIFAVLAFVTMTMGNIAALTQRSMTRLLAYSSIAQAGYILIGFVPFAYNQQTGSYLNEATIGIIGSLYHVINHAIMKGVAFVAAALVLLALKRADLNAYDGLGKRMPLTALTISISFLALAGIPPLNGFWSKLLLFLSVVNGPFAWLAVAGVLNSAFSLGYYAWIIKRMYIDEPESNGRINEPRSYIIIFITSIALIVGLGIFPQEVIDFLRASIPSIIH